MPALHRVELFERETVRLGDVLRSDSGTVVRFARPELDALLRFNDRTGQRYFQAGHERVTVRHHVGYLEVGRLAIEILPKADRTASRGADTRPWRTGLLHMLRAATGMRLETLDASSQQAGRSTLLHLVALRFVEEVEMLLREGLAKGYRAHEENGATFRGRLLVGQNLRENLAREDRFYVRYVTYDRDILVNRILRAALTVLGTLSLPEGTRSRAAACCTRFPEVVAARAHPEMFDRIQIGRSTARYADALVLARMILEQRAPELRAGSVPVFALLFDMEALWERYVAAVFRKAIANNCLVTTQEPKLFWKSGVTARKVKPDIIVKDAASRRVVFIADTKWKVVEDGVPGDDDLKQMFVYNELFRAPRSVLIYPTAGDSRARDGAYSVGGHECRTAHLGLLDDGTWGARRIEEQVRALVLRMRSQVSVDAA